jgi:uncharacterized OB-fold protein
VSGSPDAVWRDALAGGRVLLQRARASGTHFFPPRLAEPRTGDEEWDWVEASGLGTVYSVTVVNRKPPAAPYNVALIDLDEGPRMMSRVEGVPAEAVTIGLRVRARIDAAGDAPILLFDPA